jgi:serine/threonine protein kinase/ribosomal protein L25 (general stress protein Ctc)
MRIADQWETMDPLGEGGMGMVWKVRHYQMEEYILAVKMLSPELMENQSLVARFYREGSVMSRFRHDHIVRVFSAGAVYDESLRRHYILMEYIPGKALRDHLKDIRKGDRKPFSLAEVIELARQVGEALAHAHNQTPPVIHRDIKPGNIMIENPSKKYPLGRAVLMDWGIAKELKDSDDTQLTGMWMMVGTPKYCSPEQMRPLDAITGSTDIYSLGMVLYEMYTGRQFFADLDTESVVRKVRDDPEENEPHFDQPTPPAFSALIRKAIAKSRSRRYQRIEEFLRDLELCREVDEELTAATVVRPVAAVVEPENREGLRRRLEEQQRGITLELQQETSKVREQATQEGAEEWANALLQQAIVQEQEGAKRLAERNYPLAQDAYNEAIRLFGQARDEAVAFALRRAEQARNEMMTAKADAERYRAREKARRFYTSGLALENEGSERWEQKRYHQAWEVFTKAKSAFEDARELAAETLRNDAQTAREQVETSRESAAAVGAVELARSQFETASQYAEEAAAALEREDFTQARQLYESAAQQYMRALQQARVERERQEAIAAQRQAAADAHARLEETKASGDALRLAVEEQWAEAQQWESRGEEAYRNEQYEEAQQAYEQALRGYAKAKEEGAMLQRAAIQARTQAEQAQAAAQQAQASVYANEVFQEGEEAWQRATRSYEEGRYGLTVAQYEAAAHRYQAAQTEAEQARRLHAQAVEQQQQAAQAQQTAVTAQAELYASDLFHQAQAAHVQGEQHLVARRWEDARVAFAQARAAFSQAQQEARQTKKQAQQAAEAAREQAVGARREAVTGERLFPERWAQAVAIVTQATQALTAEDYETAQTGFTQATAEFRQLFEAVREIAEREALKAAAEAAQERVEERRKSALAVDAQELARPTFDEAEKRAREANEVFAQEQFTHARRLYEAVAQLYDQAQQQAQAERARRELLAAQRQAADETKQQLLTAKVAGAAFQQSEEEQWAEAQRWEQHGEDAYQGEQYEEAQRAYEAAAQQYAQVQVEGARRKHAVEKARTEAVRVQQTAREAGAQEYAADLWQQSERQWGEAEQQEQSGHYGQAAVQYEAARQAYTAAHTAAVAARRRHEQAITARERAAGARQEAIAAQAEEYAQDRFQQAQTAYAQGETYLQEKRWGEAAEAFARAHPLFTQAQQAAQQARTQARQAAEVARAQAIAAQQAAAGGEKQFAERWAQAVSLFAQASQLLAAEDYSAAQTGLTQAVAQFQHIADAVQELAEREARKAAAETAREHAERCREEAIAAEGATLARDLFASADQCAQEAVTAFAQENFIQAQQQYEAAAQLYGQARQQAQAERQRQELLVAQRRAADEAQQQLLVAKEAGTVFQQAVEEHWAEAQRWEQQGEEAYRKEQYEEALHAYEAGTQQYRQVRQEGEQRQQKAEGTRAQAEQARAAAMQARVQEYAADLFRQGESAEQTAGHAYTERRYPQATQHYAQAVLQYEKARATAEEGQRLHEQALAGKKQSEKAQQGAVAAEAQPYVPELFAQAQAAHAQGEQHRQAKRWDEAAEAFAQAGTFFAQAQQEAQRVKAQARQAAVSARAEAVAAQQEAATGEPIFPEQWQAGRAILAQADQALEKEDYRTAQPGFVQALTLFRKLHHDTIIHIQKGKAEQAKARTLELQTQTSGIKGRQKKRAEKVWTNAELLFQQGKYDEAGASYEEAAALLAALQEKAVQPGGTTGMRRPAVLFGAGGGLLAAGIALYWGLVVQEPIAHPPPLPEPISKGEPQPGAEVPVPPQTDPETRSPVDVSRGEQEQEPSPQIAKQESPPDDKQVEKADETPDDQRLAALTPSVPSEPLSPPQLEPPAIAPPQITTAEPRAKEVTVDEGQKLAFAVEAKGEGKLQYTWELDGKRQAEGKAWTYQPGFDDGGGKPKEVKVVVSDGKTLSTEQIWQVRVQDVNRPPQIARTTPKAGAVEMTVGETQKLSVQAADPDKGDRLTYVWSLDGKKMAEGETPNWQIPPSTSAGQYQVTAEVKDKAGLKDQVAWNVTVKAPAQPPLITAASPRDEKLTTRTGEPLDFSVTANVADGSSAAARRLRYQWTVNNASPRRTDTGQFRFTETKSGTYQLQVVAISPEGLQSSAKKWTIEVKAPDIAALPPEPVTPPRPSPTELSETEARNWLETIYRQAWEGKKVDTLVQLGEVPAQEAARLQAILNGYKSFSVSLRDISVQKDGKNRAIVKFTRVDTVDGRTLPHPPKQMTIEKQPDGRIAGWR